MSSRLDWPHLGKRPALDGIRGVAIIFVLCRHVSNTAFGGAGIVGVDLFFVLSGFLITKLLLEEHSATGRLAYGKFYGRRAVRLLPALLTVVIIFAVVGMVVDAPNRVNTLLSSLFAVTYTVPFALALGFEVSLPLSTTWTLAIEEYYYLAWPLLLAGLIHFGIRGRRLVACTAGLIATATLIRVGTYLVLDYRIYTAPTTWVDALLGGSLVAILWHSGLLTRVRLPRSTTFVGAAILVALALWPGLRTSGWAYGPGLTLLWITAAVLILGVVLHGDRPEHRWLGNPVMVWFGDRSYGIYLWNSVFLLTTWVEPRALQAVLGVAATLLVADVSRRLIEKPVQGRFHARFVRPRSGVVAEQGARPSGT